MWEGKNPNSVRKKEVNMRRKEKKQQARSGRRRYREEGESNGEKNEKCGNRNMRKYKWCRIPGAEGKNSKTIGRVGERGKRGSKVRVMCFSGQIAYDPDNLPNKK